jgi:hypothetical protein
MRPRPLFVVATAAVSLLVSASAAPALSTGQLPPDLQRLLTAEHHLTVRQFVERETVTGLSKHGRSHTVTVTLSGRFTGPDPVFVSKYSTTGAGTVRIVIDRGEAYATGPALPRVTGHRCVKAPVKDGADAGPAITRQLRRSLDAAVAGLSTVREVGPVTADGQAVTEFDGTGKFGVGISARLFVAANGLLVRAVQRFGSEVDTADVSLTTRVIVHRTRPSVCIDVTRLTKAQKHALNNLGP